MSEPTGPPWFCGDLDDPWVASIGEALPAGSARHHCAGDLPEAPPEGASAWVVHRQVLTRFDFEIVSRWRTPGATVPRFLLCFGPHVRHDELALWGTVMDGAFPEATARDTVASYLAPGARREGPRGRVAVVSAMGILRAMLTESCEAAGFAVVSAASLAGLPPGLPAVWDVPVLEPGWPEELERGARLGPVVALLGFADRAGVTRARLAGASACLDLPLDLGELAAVLDRVTGPRAEPAHAVPPAPAHRRSGPRSRRVAERGLDS